MLGEQISHQARDKIAARYTNWRAENPRATVQQRREKWQQFELDATVEATKARTARASDPLTDTPSASTLTNPVCNDYDESLPVQEAAILPPDSATSPAPAATFPADEAEREATSSEENGDDGKQSQASQLVAFVVERSELFHDANGAVFAQDKQTRETRRIDGRQFRDWLLASFYTDTKKSVRDQSMREAQATLSGIGRHHGDSREVHVRIAAHGGAYYIDLAQPGQSSAVRVEPGRWEIVTDPPVCFIRTETMRPLPTPMPEGDITPLWQVVNIPEQSRLLVLAWLIETMRPETPFPVLELLGEQGGAKSTTQTALRRTVDPNACDLRAAPKSVEDVFVSAGVSLIVSYENLSHLSAPMQDALCTIATGGGFAKRKLYSDADESVIVVKRPVVINSISAVVTAQDLVDRTISVEMPVMKERVEITELWRKFDAAHPNILGALFDLMAGALQRLPSIRLLAGDRPRLLEFALLGMALAEAMGKPATAFMEQFKASRQEAIARTIDANPVAAAVLEWLGHNPVGARATASQLMEMIEKYRPANSDAWPRCPRGFTDALRRAAPALRQVGVECHSYTREENGIPWEIRRQRGNSQRRRT